MAKHDSCQHVQDPLEWIERVERTILLLCVWKSEVR